MTAQTPSTLKTYFETGDKPAQAQFANLIDSFINSVQTSGQSIASDVSAQGSFSIANDLQVGSVVVGAPMGGNKGVGTVNATGIYVNGTLITTSSAGGSGTVNAGTANQLAYYPASTNTVGGTNAIPNGTTATTQAAGDASTKPATTAYIDRGISGASMVLLSQSTANNSASISFLNIPAGYDTYFISISNAVPVTNGVSFELLFSVNNGSSYLSANYINIGLRNSTSGTATYGGTSYVDLGGAATVDNTTGGGVSGHIFLHGLTNSTTGKLGEAHGYVFSGGSYNNWQSTVGNTGTTAVNAIQFIFSSGNINTGSFSLYGIRNS